MTTIEFSKYILYKLNKEQIYVSFTSLNLFIYYCQAWCYTLFGIELINELPEADVGGPRYASLYDHYREAVTSNRCLNCNLTSEELKLDNEDFDNYLITLLLKSFDEEKATDTRDVCEEVLERYTENLKISDLLNLYYREDPHSDARGNIKPLERCHNKISLVLMKSYFVRKLEIEKILKQSENN